MQRTAGALAKAPLPEADAFGGGLLNGLPGGFLTCLFKEMAGQYAAD